MDADIENNTDDPLRKCDECKITKPKSLFHRYKYYRRCYIKSYIKGHINLARIAKYFNLSMDKLEEILTIKKGPGRNCLGEHIRYDEIMLKLQGGIQSTIITEEVIDNFLDEIF